MQKDHEVVKDTFGMLLPHGDPFVWRRTLRRFLNGVELCYALDHFLRRCRSRRAENIDKLPPVLANRENHNLLKSSNYMSDGH